MKNLKNPLQEFEKTLDWICPSYDRETVFRDWLTMSVCAYHSTNILSGCTKQDPDNERIYMDTIKRYSREQLDGFSRMLACYTLFCQQNEYEDGLGNIYMDRFYTKGASQYFTPMELCKMMARLNIPDNTSQKTILDPCCGSGRTLLAAAEFAPDNYFFGCDISNICVKMTLLNFMLNGMRAEIAWGNTINLDIWQVYRVNFGKPGIHEVDRKESWAWNYPTQAEIEEMEKQNKLKEAEEMKKRLEEGKKEFGKFAPGQQLKLF